MARPPGVDRRGDRRGHPAAVVVQRDPEQQRQVPAGQRAQRARRGAGRAVRHGWPAAGPGGRGPHRVAADPGRRDGPVRAPGQAEVRFRRRQGPGRRGLAQRSRGAARRAGLAAERRQPERRVRPGGRAARQDRGCRAAGRAAGAPGRGHRRTGGPAEGVRQYRRQDRGIVAAAHHRPAGADLPVADAGADHPGSRAHLVHHCRSAGRRGREARAAGVLARPVPDDRAGAGGRHRLRAVPGLPGPRGTARGRSTARRGTTTRVPAVWRAAWPTI